MIVFLELPRARLLEQMTELEYNWTADRHLCQSERRLRRSYTEVLITDSGANHG